MDDQLASRIFLEFGKMEEPDWANIKYKKPDFQAIKYYALQKKTRIGKFR